MMNPNLPRRMSSANPFASLFRGPSQDGFDHPEPPEPSLNDQLEDIFSFTLNEKTTLTKEILFLEESHKELYSTVLTMDNIDQVLFERLFMCQKDNEILNNNKRLGYRNQHAIEIEPLKYLYKSYVKLHANLHLKAEDRLSLKDKIIQNVSTSIFQPDIFPEQDLEQQMIDLLKEGGAQYDTFFVEAARRMLDDENNDDIILTSFIDQMNRKITTELKKSSLLNLDYNIFNYFNVFTSNDYLAEIFMDCCVPFELHKGSEYANTPIGALFDISVLPKDPKQSNDHFTSPLDKGSNSRIEGLLWSSQDKLSDHVHQFLLVLLKRNTIVKNKVLTWIGGCLKYNIERGKLWNNMHQMPQFPNENGNKPVSDGFMINFCSIMLRLCRPFCGNYKDKRILKVDPSYPAVPTRSDIADSSSKGIHMYGLSSETCFIPVESNDGLEETRKSADKFNFITEIFFMAHKSIDLSFRVMVDHMMNLSHEIGRLEKAYKDAVQQGGPNSEIASTINQRLMSEYKKFLSLKCVLSEPILQRDLFDFTAATCYWLSQVSMKTEFDVAENETFAPLEERKVEFPLPQKIPFTLKCIPEFLVENIVSYLSYLRRYSIGTFEEVGYEKMEPVLTFLLIFMGSPDHMKNPHVRARLAEGLESLLPHHKDDHPDVNMGGGFQREMVFTHHPHRFQIVRMLMSVFVGIEMTGQSVEFEQKFKYRRPMYAIFDYVWDIPEHSDSFMALADEAEANMEAVHPPLFLRFVNLLINDAIFLLDESLTNMAKLKEMQTAHENGEWDSLGFQERAQNIASMHHIGMMARFDNVLGRDTITTLEKLTSKISSVFTHPTIVDRVASMLNYFLLNLVGPNRSNFKAKNLEEYSFDPKGTVLEIIKIYANLKKSDKFCLAISQDGRSYSPNLFSLAEEVLIRVGGGPLLGELKDLAEKVSRKAHEYRANEEAIAEAPDHFLDPIMSTLMTDPVILPSSRQTVDRTTIARHLLSDQSDPFNRSPLSMDQIIPNVALRSEIERWLKERQIIHIQQ